jgi:hypothetical protein
MLRSAAAILPVALAIFSACKPSELSHSKAIMGAVLIDGLGGPPLSDSVVVIAGGRIRAAGARSAVPVPAEADRINGAGKFIVPGLIDISRASRIKNVDARVSDGDMESARASAIPVVASIANQAEVRLLVDRGANGFLGMIPDSEELDPLLVSRLRDLRIFFAPLLGKSRAMRNTERLFRAGVPIAAASGGGDLQSELELLSEAGVPPLDVIVAATRNSAAGAGELAQSGTIEPNKRADLLLLSANPGEDIRNLRQVALRMVEGEWVR